MIYLVDANVLSEPTKPVSSSRVVDWLRANEGNLVVDSIILGELCIGILALPRGRDWVRHLPRHSLGWGKKDVLNEYDALDRALFPPSRTST